MSGDVIGGGLLADCLPQPTLHGTILMWVVGRCVASPLTLLAGVPEGQKHRELRRVLQEQGPDQVGGTPDRRRACVWIILSVGFLFLGR